MDCEILIIGGGPGGYIAAIRAARLGARTVLVEKAEVGGTCLNRGCIPTKALLASAEKISDLRKAKDFGIKHVKFEIDFKHMQARKDRVVLQLRNGVVALLKKNKVKVIHGTAEFTAPYRVKVQFASGSDLIRAEKIIIATGSKPVLHDFPGAEGILSCSDDALKWTSVPKHLVVVGGGYIGLEFAMLFNDLGSEVFLVEALPTILPGSDKEIRNRLTQILKSKGIQIHLQSRLTAVSGGSHPKAMIEGEKGSIALPADKILLAIGRQANVEELNLEKIGLEYTKKGIGVDDHFQSNLKDHYAIGDVNGKIQLAHAASAQGLYVIEKLLTGQSHQNLRFVPSCLYTNPEVASVGLTEEEALRKKPGFTVARFPLGYNGKTLSLGATEGVVKIISEPKYGEILGVHIMGPRASDIIAEATLAMRAELSLTEIASTIHAHPTVSESLMEAALLALKEPIHAV